ncbi:MAG TPA: Uma2 family endonuclease [Thermoanaerobaculia bacterium]|nr:Uma2 family endonuclease [Thermoanaerobaculia bacterium]
MAEPARNPPPPWDPEPDDDESGTVLLQRWVERPDGRLELLEMPLTPEVFLDPQLEDKMTQGEWHSEATTDLSADIRGFLRSKRADVLVLSDVKHYLGIPDLPNPAPDVSVIYGIRRPLDQERPDSFDLVKERAKPSFVLEVISPKDRKIREADEVDKVEIYQRVGIPEYFLLDTPRRKNGFRFHLKGYRLNSRGRYRLIQPDPEGRLLSEQTGLWFSVSPAGDRIVLMDAATGKTVLSREEQEAALRAAEAEIARLRERLRETGG